MQIVLIMLAIAAAAAIVLLYQVDEYDAALAKIDGVNGGQAPVRPSIWGDGSPED